MIYFGQLGQETNSNLFLLYQEGMSQIYWFAKGDLIDAFKKCHLYENNSFPQVNQPIVFFHFSNSFFA